MRIVPPLRGVSCAVATPAPAITAIATSPKRLRIDHPSCFPSLVRIPSCLSALCKRNADMPDLPNCLLIVTAEVDASVEADWNRWYDEVHVPDVLACPGVRGGRRYLSSGKAVEWDRAQRR